MPASTQDMRAIAEVRETDAPAEIAEIYADIKARSGIPQTNLIWRHFATEPEVLRWAWGAIAPLFDAGAVQAAADQLSGQIGGDGGSAIWHVIADPQAAADVKAILAFYNRGNPRNLVSLTALSLWAANAANGHADEPAPLAMPHTPLSAAERRNGGHLGDNPSQRMPPPLPKRDDLAEAEQQRVTRLAAAHGGAALGVTPSMYLHIALYPDVLAEAERRLSSHVASAAFAHETAAVISCAQTCAAALSAQMTRDAPPPQNAAGMLAIAQNFIETTIPEMIVVGAALAGRPPRADA